VISLSFRGKLLPLVILISFPNPSVTCSLLVVIKCIVGSIRLSDLSIYLSVFQWSPSCWFSVVFRHSCRFIATLDVKFLCFVTLCTLLPVALLVVLLQVPMSLFLYSTCFHYLMYILFTLRFVQCLYCSLQLIICRHTERLSVVHSYF